MTMGHARFAAALVPATCVGAAGCAGLAAEGPNEALRRDSSLVEMEASAEPTTPDGHTTLWVRFMNPTGRELSFALEMAHRVAEDPTRTYAYSTPTRTPRCGVPGSPTYRLAPRDAFEIRLDVATPSPLAERVLVSAEIQLCDSPLATYRVYAETPLATDALATTLSGNPHPPRTHFEPRTARRARR